MLKNAKVVSAMKMYLFVCLIQFVFQSTSWAYFSFLDNGEVLPEGTYNAQAALQNVTSKDSSGVNLIAQLDTNAGKNGNFRLQLGSGATDYFGGFFYKWSPIPDVDNQPALGVVLGTIVAKENDESLVAVPIKGFITKNFQFSFANLSPYLALSTSLLVTNDEADNPSHFIIGTEWFPTENEPYSVFIEFGGNVSDAFNYIAASFSYKFSESE